MDTGLNETRMKMLGELAELSLVLARDLQAAALEADTTEEKIRLADAFHRMGRGVRQSLALHAKLERDLQRAAREDEAHALAAAPVDKARREGRAARLETEVQRLIWTEREKLDANPRDLELRLVSLLRTQSHAEDFLDTDPQLQILRLCEMLGVPSPTPSNSERHSRPCKPGNDGANGSFRSSA